MEDGLKTQPSESTAKMRPPCFIIRVLFPHWIFFFAGQKPAHSGQERCASSRKCDLSGIVLALLSALLPRAQFEQEAPRWLTQSEGRQCSNDGLVSFPFH